MQVYFAQDRDSPYLIKIGCSINPHSRIYGLSSQTKSRLKILALVRGSLSKEKWLHKYFVKYRAHGEWFFPHKKLMACIPLKQVPPMF